MLWFIVGGGGECCSLIQYALLSGSLMAHRFYLFVYNTLMLWSAMLKAIRIHKCSNGMLEYENIILINIKFPRLKNSSFVLCMVWMITVSSILKYVNTNAYKGNIGFRVLFESASLLMKYFVYKEYYLFHKQRSSKMVFGIRHKIFESVFFINIFLFVKISNRNT